MATKSSAIAFMLLWVAVVCVCCGSIANAEVVATHMAVASSAAQPTDAPKSHPGRWLLQACGRDSIECKSWGPSQCDRPGVPDKCPCMCGSGSSAGGSGGLPTIVINNANNNNNENIATGGNAKGGSATTTRGLLQTPNNQNSGAIGGNAVSGDATGANSRSGDARGGDARMESKMTKVDTKIDSKVNGKLFGRRKLLENAAVVLPSMRGLLQTPNNQNSGAIGGNAACGAATSKGARSGDARGCDASSAKAVTSVHTQINSKTFSSVQG